MDIGSRLMIGLCLSVIRKHCLPHDRILLTLAVWSVFCLPAFADGVKGFQEIYATPVPVQIRKNFDALVEIQKTCPECWLGVLDGEKFVGIYPKKFIVLSIEPCSFGGVWAFIAVESERRDTFRLWLYDVDEEEYDLRSIEELPESLGEEFNRWLDDPAHDPYWL